MELVHTRVLVGATRETWTIHHLTDLHIDDHDFADQELRARIAEIEQDPRALWLGGGDYGSLILPSDRRFATGSESVHRLPDVYIERMEAFLAPIAGKCIGLGTGNHEWTIGKSYHRGVVPELAMRLGIPEKYLGERGWALVTFDYPSRKSTMTLRCYQFHGWSAGRLRGRKALQAERDLGAWNADVFFLGHDHQPYDDLFYTQEPYHSVHSGWHLRNRPRAVVNGGSWTYGQRPPASEREKRGRKASEWPNASWAEGKNFRPQAPVSPVVLVHLDFGNAAVKARGNKGRRAGFELETRLRAPTFYVGGEAA